MGPEGWEAGRTGQCLKRLASKGSRGVGEIQANGVEASDLGHPNNKVGPKKVVFKSNFSSW